MGTHLIPRSDVKGQDRLFIFFTGTGLVGTVIGAAICYPIYLLFSLLFGQSIYTLLIVVLGGLFGFCVGQVKVPDTNGSPIFKKCGGLYIRDVIISYLKFNANKKKYVLQVGKDDVFVKHEETQLEKLLLNKVDDDTKKSKSKKV